MLIKQGYFVRNLYLKNRKYPITFTYGGSHSIKVLIKNSSKKFPSIKGHNDLSVCRACGTFKPSDKIRQYFISISNNELPNEMADNAKVLEYLKKTAKSVERIHIDYFPQPFKDFMHNVRSELHDIIKRTVGIYMWRCGIPGGHDPLFNGGMSFSLDGKKWNIVPPGIKIEAHAATILQTPNRISLSLKKLINNVQEQPVGHQLFREAQYLRDTNPRISIVVAISALEVAVKECISQLNPNSNWLVENLPSPDVRKLINEYIPKLLCKTTLERVLPLPKYLDDTIRKGVQIRNQVAHLGRKAPSRESTNEILSTVQDVLWLLDICSGHKWPLEYISKDTSNHIKEKMKSKD